MNKYLSLGNFYISLWFLNTFQGLYIVSSFVSLILYIPFILISLYYTYIAIISYNKIDYIRSLFALFFLLAIYGTIHILFGEDYKFEHRIRDNREFLVSILSSFTPIFAFYVMTIKEKFKLRDIYIWIIPFLIVTTLEYNKTMLDLAHRFQNYGFDEFTNNIGYIFLSIVPLIFFLRKKQFFQYIILAYTLSYTMTSMKRGAIIIGVVMLIWFIKSSLNLTSKRKKFYIYAMVFALICAAYYFVIDLFLNSDYFQYRIEQTIEGNTSNRNNIYSSLINLFLLKHNFVELIFGFGADGSIALSGNLAHSDWIELLVDCGIIGVIIYIIYWITFAKTWKYSKNNEIIYYVLGACFIFTFSRTIMSMSFSDTPFYISMALGFCMGTIYKSQYHN